MSIFLERYMVCGFKELQLMLADPARPLNQFAAVVSVVPTFGGVKAEADVVAAGYNTQQHFFYFLDHYDPDMLAAPGFTDVERGLAVTNIPGKVLAHCFAGKSRSVAILNAAANRDMGAGHEHAILDAICIARPKAIPNPLYTMYADYLLGRNGAMVEALLDHPGLADKYELWLQSINSHLSAAEQRHAAEFAENSQAAAPALYVKDPNRVPHDVRTSASFAAFKAWQRRFTPDAAII
jgi:hypothetical protein